MRRETDERERERDDEAVDRGCVERRCRPYEFAWIVAANAKRRTNQDRNQRKNAAYLFGRDDGLVVAVVRGSAALYCETTTKYDSIVSSFLSFVRCLVRSDSKQASFLGRVGGSFADSAGPQHTPLMPPQPTSKQTNKHAHASEQRTKLLLVLAAAVVVARVKNRARRSFMVAVAADWIGGAVTREILDRIRFL
jgi:hypothetical protein